MTKDRQRGEHQGPHIAGAQAVRPLTSVACHQQAEASRIAMIRDMQPKYMVAYARHCKATPVSLACCV